MRRPRDLALRAGFYVAVALSSFAAAYMLKEWLPHLWEARNPPRVLPTSDDDKTSPRSSLQQDRSPKTEPSAHPRQTDEVPPVSPPATDPDHTFALSPNTDVPTPSTSQTKSLPPLRTHSLPPPLPSGHALLSGSSSFAINLDTIPSPTSAGSFHTSSGEDGVDDDAASQTNTSDTLADSFLDVLSPTPAHVISRRRSMRAHDLFAASHISFAELGSLVTPENGPE